MSALARAFIAAFVVLVCATTVFSASKNCIQANFKETRTNLPNASFSGTLVYYYDASVNGNSRLLLKYQVSSSTTVSNMYHYGAGGMYSMLGSQCTGSKFEQTTADPWYVTSNYTKGTQVGSMFWYNRNNVDKTVQVKRILMTASTSPSASGYLVDTIEFNDGRTLKLTNFKYGSVDDSAFNILSSCPEPSCPIYADIVFVLDYSGSLSKSDWSDTMTFVTKVTDSFTFGYDGVAASALMFTTGATMIAPNVGYSALVDNSVSGAPMYNKNQFKNLINAYIGRTPSGGTYQGSGLIYAKYVLKKGIKNRPNKKPAGIVIAVTDGGDWYETDTANAADALRNELGALVIEIGVGYAHTVTSYRNFLQRIASKLGGKPVYYNASDYNAVKTIADQITAPLCDQFSTDECKNCNGLCSNGKCFCPTCTATGSTCHINTCQASGASATGCVTSPIKCDATQFPENVCQWYSCDGTKTDAQGRCSVVMNPCNELKSKYTETCREIRCSTSAGGCYVYPNDAYCQSTFGNACEDYECTPVGQTVPSQFSASGCRLKTDKKQEYQKELEKTGESKCFRAACNKNTGLSKEDFCEESNTFNKCYSSKCIKDGGVYKCNNTEKNRPSDTACTTYKCSDDASKGWVVKSSENTETCTAKFEAEKVNSTKCQNVYCDPKGGCKKVKIDGCDFDCTEKFIKDCIADAAQPSVSSPEHCVLGVCQNVEDTPGHFNLFCNQEQSVSNCLVDMAEEVEKLNKADPSICYTPACGADGRCTYESLPVPTDYKTTKCMEPVCVKQDNGSWIWEYHETELSTKCKTDECCTRVCDDNEGCLEEDICLVKNKGTECVRYSCNAANGKCEEESLLITTNCTYEVCENGKKVIKENLEVCDEHLPSLCHYSFCVYDATTVTSYCDYDFKPNPGDDPCTKYECDNTTGEFHTGPICDDGLFCTEDECNYCTGPECEKPYICKNKEIDCTEEISMEGYPCFDARCREEEKGHRCVRKLIRNAYIDICGRCIKEKEVKIGTDSGSNSTSSSSEDMTDVLECTGAPAKPILTEGLAAASIALIIIFAILIGSAITASSIIGTKTLIARSKAADNQSAHVNPLYQDNEAEMVNPAFETAAEE